MQPNHININQKDIILNQKKLLFLFPPLLTALPILIHSPTKASADTSIRIVSLSQNGNEIQNLSNTTSLINSTPDTGIVASQPTSISSNSPVSNYVPVNVINKNKEELQQLRQKKEAKEAYLQLLAKKEAIAKAKELAEQKAKEAQIVAEQKARDLAKKQIKDEQEKADKEAEQKELLTQATTQSSQQETSPSTTPTSSSSTPSPSYSGGLDMNQTSGTVDITALATYMSTTVGGEIDKWKYTIEHESGGDLQNWYNKAGGNPYTQGSTAYGVFQLLGHGEYLGMPLKDQIALAQQVFLSSGWGAWVASYGY